jgi:ABC-type lipoprotein export system ATPase subunit
MSLIELNHVSKTYHVGEMGVPAVKDVSLTIEKGEFIALMGASGSGKSTLMNILGCLDRPTGGKYFLEGRDISQISADERALLRNSKLGFVFQNFNLLARTTSLENVIMPFTYTRDGISDRQAIQRGTELLKMVGLGDRMYHEPSQLSGGEQQRVAIARALVNKPSILFADEPTGNLDSKTSEEILRLFQRLNKDELITVILVTHDPNIARHTKRLVKIHDGMIVNSDS